MDKVKRSIIKNMLIQQFSENKKCDKIDIEFIADRITQLRLQMGVSEGQMSLDLGKSRNYIQKISSKSISPSLKEFLNICDYFHISPADFFETDLKDPALVEQLKQELKSLSSEDLKSILHLVERINESYDIEKIYI